MTTTTTTTTTTSSSSSSSSEQPQPPPNNPLPSPQAPDSLISPPASLHYWSSTPASLSGILGGYPQISLTDLRGSKSFLTKLLLLLRRRHSSASQQRRSIAPAKKNGSKLKLKLKLGLDCGAGIGRVTKAFLAGVCEVVDVVEPVRGFVDVLRREMPVGGGEGRLGRVWVCGLEGWDPESIPAWSSSSSSLSTMEGVAVGSTEEEEDDDDEREEEQERRGNKGRQYDLIWAQWCLGHLTDVQLAAFFQLCATIISPEGWIVVKENMSTDPEGQDIYDEVDSSVTRTDGKFRSLFEEAGLSMVRTELQGGFPKGLGLYPVRMYGLRPKERGEGEGVTG